MLVTLVIMTLIVGFFIGFASCVALAIHSDKRDDAKAAKEIQAPGLIDYTKPRPNPIHN